MLVAEDDAVLAQQIARRLRATGWQVNAVEDGEAAVATARSRQHDVMLLDLRLPRIDGLRVLDAIRDVPAAPPVVLMSGYLDEPTVQAARRSGAAEVLEKPFAPQRLSDLLFELAERHRSITRPTEAFADLLVPELLGESAAARTLRAEIIGVARFRDLPVMIIGETGTGKELVASAIHRLSGTTDPMISINCAAMPEALFESEVFGHDAGAFTGARGARAGLLQAAGHGTVFLDEVGELPPTQQAKLLRVLENRTFRRVGANIEQPLHARIVSATNRPLRGRGDEALRADLFFRLAVHSIRSPSLRERMEDIDVLARHFLDQFSITYASTPLHLTDEARATLHEHDWPGNIRELRGVLLSAAIRSNGRVIDRPELLATLRTRRAFEPAPAAPAPVAPPREAPGLPQVQRELIVATYEECGGNLTVAAMRLQIARSTLRDRLRRYGIR